MSILCSFHSHTYFQGGDSNMRFDLQPAQVLVNNAINNNNHSRSSIDVDRLDNELASTLRFSNETNLIYDNSLLAATLNGNLGHQEQYNCPLNEEFILSRKFNGSFGATTTNTTGLLRGSRGSQEDVEDRDWPRTRIEGEENDNNNYFDDYNRTNLIYNKVKFLITYSTGRPNYYFVEELI